MMNQWFGFHVVKVQSSHMKRSTNESASDMKWWTNDSVWVSFRLNYLHMHVHVCLYVLYRYQHSNCSSQMVGVAWITQFDAQETFMAIESALFMYQQLRIQVGWRGSMLKKHSWPLPFHSICTNDCLYNRECTSRQGYYKCLSYWRMLWECHM